MDSLFTHGAQRLNESKSLTKDINLSEKYGRCFSNIFLIVVLAAFTYGNILTHGLTVKNLIHMSCHQIFFFSRHDINISRIDPQYNPGKDSIIIDYN